MEATQAIGRTKGLAMILSKTAMWLLCGAALLSACDAQQDEPAAEPTSEVEPTGSPPAAPGLPPPSDSTMPSEEPEPAMADELPTSPNPPPSEPKPPGG